MFETLKNVFRVKEMRRKLLYLIWMIFIIRIGCQIPVPGVDSDFFKQWFSSNTGDAFNFFDDISILRGKREEDFAPIKNKEGNDSPETAKKLYNEYWRR